MRLARTFFLTAFVLLTVGSQATLVQSQAPKMVRSLSGPSGKVVGSDFQFDETRNRFVFPQDQTLTVFFEWDVPAGDHVLTATWKQPDGRVASVSPDVRIQTSSSKLASYWIFTITPNLPIGAWTVEIKVDGYPAGSHAFELAGVGTATDLMTLDKVFTTYAPSVVRIHKIDAAGRPFDSSSGFVIAPNAIATAFQSIDSAARVEIEYPDGRKVQTDAVLAHSRLDDWAILKADNGAVPAIPLAEAGSVRVGSRLAAMPLESGTRVVTPVSVGAVSAPAGYGSRIRVSMNVSAESVGGPLIDEKGRAVGILGGSLTPGSRFGERAIKENPWMARQQLIGAGATTIPDRMTTLPTDARAMRELHTSGVMTPPIKAMIELSSAGTTTALPKDAGDRRINDFTEFSAASGDAVIVFGFWQRRASVPKGETLVSKGEVSATIYDADNKPRGTSTPLKMNLKPPPEYQRTGFSWPAKSLPAGYYRIDLCWDGVPVWRGYVRVVN